MTGPWVGLGELVFEGLGLLEAEGLAEADGLAGSLGSLLGVGAADGSAGSPVRSAKPASSLGTSDWWTTMPGPRSLWEGPETN
ncbi:hypothetical protein RF641_12140 [Arthrobacter sp. LS16]|uniref:hypothetical protein n=1 Tax=Arthrobacter sp. 'calajunan' TaxID=1690248 RepID=UPI003C76F21A